MQKHSIRKQKLSHLTRLILRGLFIDEFTDIKESLELDDRNMNTTELCDFTEQGIELFANKQIKILKAKIHAASC